MQNQANTEIPNSPEQEMPKESYYMRNRAARLAYQANNYKQNRSDIQRKRELRRVLHPETVVENLEYQRAYYAENRGRILQQRRNRYHERKAEGSLPKKTKKVKPKTN